MSHVSEGKLLKVTPSSLDSFDVSSRFGCPRKWWFKHVAGLPDPSTANQELGTKIHALAEADLLGKELPQEEEEDEASGVYLRGRSMVLALRPLVVSVESIIDTSLFGVRFVGRCDLVTTEGIVDWKTTSDMKRYGKTPSDLASDTQMILYAWALRSGVETVKLSHGYFGTKRHEFGLVTSPALTQQQVSEVVYGKVHKLVEEMHVAAKATNSNDVEGVLNDKCFRCNFRSKCPDKKAETIMSIFKTINQPKTGFDAINPPDAEPTPPAVPEFEPAPAPTEVKPPPSPTPQPPKTTVEDAPRKRGRPRKNAVEPTVVRYNPPPVPEVQAPMLRTITVTRGGTVNLGNYSSARFEVSCTYDVSGDTQENFEMCDAEVTRLATAEINKIAEGVKLDEKNSK